MKSCIEGFFEDGCGLAAWAVVPRGERLLTDAEIGELLRDLPAQVLDFCPETPERRSKIA